MRLLLQKVSQAAVSVNKSPVSCITRGYLLFLGVIKGDTEEEAKDLAEKVTRLRLFPGNDGKINDRSILEVQGEILVVSQFTLAGSVKKGNRPDYTSAAKPNNAETLYNTFVQHFRTLNVSNVETGVFGAPMEVTLTNDGPVTLFIEQ